MNVFHKYTPVRVAVPFCAGIIFGLIVKPDFHAVNSVYLSAAMFAGNLAVFYLSPTEYASRWVFGLSALLSLAVTGWALVNLIGLGNHARDQMVNSSAGGTMMICRLKSKPMPKTGSFSAEAEISGLKDSTGIWKTPGAGVLIYFMNDSSCRTLQYGDMILVSGLVREIAAPMNPGAFNFREYLRNRQIRWQLNLEQHQWQATGHHGGNPLRLWSEQSRSWFLEMLLRFKIEGEDLALAAALLLGSKDLLEKDTRQEFSHAGAMHVLCVSGLHVGIMYVVAERLLFFLKRGRRSRLIQQAIILCFIWSYAFITGLSPSVLRAGLMFSLLAAGRMMKRSNINFNILAGAAFIQLLINPLEITQLGFQLSYLAVLGIFAFYQPLNSLLLTPGRVTGWVWSVIAVSIAAQAATSPLACHYFGIFPVYFLLTNLVVIPLAGIIIYLALALGLAGAVGFNQEWLSMPLKLSIRLMHGSVEKIQSVPGAVIEPIVLDPVQVLLIYVILTGSFIFFVHARRFGLFMILLAALLSGIASAVSHFKNITRSEFIVYYVPGHSAADLIHDRHAVFLHDSLLNSFPEKIDSRIRPYRLKTRIKSIESMVIENRQEINLSEGYYSYPFLFYKGKKIAFINEGMGDTITADKINLDILVILGNRQISLDEISAQFVCNNVIIDSSVPLYRAMKYVEYCRSAGISCHSVRHEGAWVIRW